ncbi:MAG: hypothetical protein ACM34C_02775 [Syntrophaceae bacterium]
MTRSDGAGQPLDGSKHNYTLTFAKDPQDRNSCSLGMT